MADKRKEFIRKYKHIAIREMERTGIPASITLAQGILESGCGESELAVNANNHFGIKCHETWNGDTYTMDDDTRDECFRKYKNIEQSWIAHTRPLSKETGGVDCRRQGSPQSGQDRAASSSLVPHFEQNISAPYLELRMIRMNSWPMPRICSPQC